MYIIQYALYNELCTLHIYTLYTCTLYNMHCTMNSVHCIYTAYIRSEPSEMLILYDIQILMCFHHIKTKSNFCFRHGTSRFSYLRKLLYHSYTR